MRREAFPLFPGQLGIKALFHHAHDTGQPWFHLWGHSWEIEKYGMWGILETFLQWVSTQPDVTCVPNSAIIPQVAPTDPPSLLRELRWAGGCG